MNKAYILLTKFTLMFLLMGCAEKVEKVEIDDLVHRDGLYYKKFNEEVFSGTVVGSAKGKVIEGKQVGEWTWWHPNGQLNMRVRFKDGKPHGLMESFFESGKKLLRVTFEDGKKVGTLTQFYENGNKRRIENYSYGILDGDKQYYFENGDMMYWVQYEDGIKDGMEFKFHVNGNQSLRSFNKNGKRHGQFSTYYEDGKLQSYGVANEGDLGDYVTWVRRDGSEKQINCKLVDCNKPNRFEKKFR